MNNDELLAAFTATGLPVGHLDAFKAGAALKMKPQEAHLLAKRLIVNYIDSRLKHTIDHYGITNNQAFNELELLRSYIRNVCLWNSKWDTMDYNQVIKEVLSVD
jgi:hypothetical protein